MRSKSRSETGVVDEHIPLLALLIERINVPDWHTGAEEAGHVIDSMHRYAADDVGKDVFGVGVDDAVDGRVAGVQFAVDEAFGVTLFGAGRDGFGGGDVVGYEVSRRGD